jgi:hypothetical protein
MLSQPYERPSFVSVAAVALFILFVVTLPLFSRLATTRSMSDFDLFSGLCAIEFMLALFLFGRGIVNYSRSKEANVGVGPSWVRIGCGGMGVVGALGMWLLVMIIQSLGV